MSGDVVEIFGKSYYHTGGVTPNNNNLISNALQTFLGTIAGSAAVSTSHTGVTGAVLNNNTGTTSPLTSWLNGSQHNATSNTPRAYINWIFLDEQFNTVTSGGLSGADPVNSTSDVLKNHYKTVSITKNGYLYVYCSNESDIDVFFDNLQVVHSHGPLVSEDHYYPFGLTMAGISSKALNFGQPENNRLYNKGSELQHHEFSDGSGLELYSTEFRSLDPQLGRWWQIDPKASESESPYVSMSNNPIRFNDPLGDTIIDAQIKADKNWGKAYNTWLNSRAGKRFEKLYSSGGKYGTSTVEFKVGKTNSDNSAEGNTKVYSMNRTDGTATELNPDKKYNGISKVAGGESKDRYLKFDVTLRQGEDMSTSTEQVEGGESILHETQHVRTDQQTLITDNVIVSPFIIHRDFMKPTSSDWYQERSDFYKENRQMWQADYERQKAQGKVGSETEYIQKKVNDFFN